jgi:hypothetical protein
MHSENPSRNGRVIPLGETTAIVLVRHGSRFSDQAQLPKRYHNQAKSRTFPTCRFGVFRIGQVERQGPEVEVGFQALIGEGQPGGQPG